MPLPHLDESEVRMRLSVGDGDAAQVAGFFADLAKVLARSHDVEIIVRSLDHH